MVGRYVEDKDGETAFHKLLYLAIDVSRAKPGLLRNEGFLVRAKEKTIAIGFHHLLEEQGG